MSEKSDFLKSEVEPFHIAFGIDANYFRYVAITMVSILENNPDQLIHFHILTENCPPNIRQNFQQIEATYQTTIHVHLPDLAVFKDLYDFSAHSQYSPAIFTRLMIPATLKGIAKTVLYLDADIICAGSIADLSKIDMSDKIVAAVSDDINTTVKYRCAALQIESGRYFNSGVMLMNVDNWLNKDVTQQVFNTLKNSQQRFLHPDQDALNLVLGDSVFYIDERWNLRYNLEFMLRKGQVTASLGEAVFMHFTGPIKPWLNWNLHNSKALFIHYQNLTPWRNTPLDPPKTYTEMRAYVRFLLPQKKYGQAVFWFCKYLITKFFTSKT